MKLGEALFPIIMKPPYLAEAAMLVGVFAELGEMRNTLGVPHVGTFWGTHGRTLFVQSFRESPPSWASSTRGRD